MEIVWSVVEFTPRWKKLEMWSEWKLCGRWWSSLQDGKSLRYGVNGNCVVGGGVHSKMEKA